MKRDTLLLRVAWIDINGIDESWGIHGRGLLGGVIGAGAGGLLGAYFGSRTSIGELSSPTTGLAGGLLGAAIGGLWGALIGTLAESESWEPISVWGRNGKMSGANLGIRVPLSAIR